MSDFIDNFIDICRSGTVEDLEKSNPEKLKIENTDIDYGFLLACQYNNIKMVKALAKKYNPQNMDTNYYLHKACAFNEDIDVIKYLAEGLECPIHNLYRFKNNKNGDYIYKNERKLKNIKIKKTFMIMKNLESLLIADIRSLIIDYLW